MNVCAPSDEEVLSCLERELRARCDSVRVARIDRSPYAYATSFPLEEVVAHLNDGRTLRLILKDLTWNRLLGDAGRSKPQFLYDPRRCIETYRTIVGATGVSPDFYGASIDDGRRRYWLLIEKIRGLELWQIGDLGCWASVARWLAQFHSTFRGQVAARNCRSPHLLHYDAALFRVWPARALDVVGKQGIPADRLRRLAHIASRYDQVVDRLSAVPPVFVHGELYPSNVLVDDTGAELKVWAVDWEMAGFGPALLDLAALTAGWHEGAQERLVGAYLDEMGANGGSLMADDVNVLLDCCRLHYALQWLGWSVDWLPPPNHVQDWVSEALRLGHRLGLGL